MKKSYRSAMLAIIFGWLGCFCSGVSLAQSATDTAALKRGKILFIQCRACHDLNAEPSEKAGPDLAGVIGRRAGSAAGFSYSAAMKSAQFVWDIATLDRWLEKPSAVIAGNTMAFAGMANPADRAAIIGYLAAENRPKAPL